MNNFIELVSWDMVCHRTMATEKSPDFALIAFKDRADAYFTDVLAKWQFYVALSTNAAENGQPFARVEIPVYQEHEVPSEHDDYYSQQGDPIEGQAFFGIEEVELATVANTTTVRCRPMSHPAECCCNLCDVNDVMQETSALLIQVDLEQAVRQANIDVR